MSVFDLEKIRKDLSVYDRDMPCAMKALQILVRLCEEGQRLEAENAKQAAMIEVLIRENIFNSNSPAAHMIDCRTCDYRLNCARAEDQCHPMREMCTETVRKYAEKEAGK